MLFAKWEVTKQMKRLTKIALLTVVLAAIFFLFVFPFLPPREYQQQRAVVEIEYQRYYAVTQDGKPILYISGIDRNFNPNQVALSPDSLELETQKLRGCWVSKYLLLPHCGGRIMTANPDTAIINRLALLNNDIKSTLDQNIAKLCADSAQLSWKTDELDYYMDRHSVTDAGYNNVGSYAADMIEAREDVSQALAVLRSIDYKKRISIELRRKYTLLYNGKRIPCKISEMEVENHRQMIRTADKTPPDSAYVLYNNLVNDDFIEDVIRSKAMPHKTVSITGNTDSGHVVWKDINGNFYDGMWENGMRNGFGFAVDSTGKVRVGEWKDDKYRGERMLHSQERIYGIDIARYQHEQGRRRYKIDWKNLRITSLGSISKQKSSGKVDYPVSFCYIKATEGTTVTNSYYDADYREAHRHGIPCGSYHFFSTKSSGKEQAAHFLSVAKITKNDFPPVLDIEPSAGQIAAMGGTEALFKAVRTWLNIVEQRTGHRPILYISQMFVRKYLDDAPDLKKKYQVWIARYGEYRPDVRLLFWQLCPDGRVSGIVPQVDINVFNGDREQFEEYVRNSSNR